MNKYFKIGQNFKFNIYPVVQDIYYHFQIADVKISIRSSLHHFYNVSMFVMVAGIYGQICYGCLYLRSDLSYSECYQVQSRFRVFCRLETTITPEQSM